MGRLIPAIPARYVTIPAETVSGIGRIWLTEQLVPMTGMDVLMTNAAAVHVLIRLNLMVRLARMAEPAKMAAVLVHIRKDIVVTNQKVRYLIS